MSIIVSVLNSHEVVRRQLLYFEKSGVPDDVEIIYLDDGSNPPLQFETKLKNFTIYPTNDFREWTVAFARNLGARLAKGELLLMTDIDYIITPKAIEEAKGLKEDKMAFKRQFGVLDEKGRLRDDFDILRSYGLLEERIQRKGTKCSPHPNNFVMRKDVYWRLGGYPEDRMHLGYPKCTSDSWFKRNWDKNIRKGKVTVAAHRPILYMFPTGRFCGETDYNPFNLFHNLTRKTEGNYWYHYDTENKNQMRG